MTGYEYMEKHLGQLVNRTVIGLVNGDSDSEWGLQFDDGTVAWIMSDPEGNDPGHLDIDQTHKTGIGAKVT